MKKLLIVSAIVLAVSASAQNYNPSTNLNIGSLTTIAASTTTNAPSTAVVQTKYHQEGWVRLRFNGSGSEAGTVRAIATFAPAKYGTNDYDTSVTSRVSFGVTNNSAGVASYGSTNIYFGSAPYWYLVSIQNGGTNSITNVAVTVDFKDRRNGLQ
jgi:hypothetical protein